ncbi:uncharacterized protein LOC125579923 [Brassica napus]|uniref:uncharacterized protein LOC125579923 n=1 Tax=Brassica napus TaxID=3708 RepID=UPI0020786442|nr:uncharacterized protein LOC125579923 [Brassica napus]
MALAVVTSARKLRPYFQSHTIEVLSNQPLRTVMQNTNQSGRLTKWAMELSEHDIVYKNRTAAKSQSFSFGFAASNNEAEYESLIAGLRLAKAMKAKRISAYCDSQLVVPRGENVCADALAALGSKLHDQVKRTIPIHKIEKPSIDTKAEQTAIAAAISEAMDIDEAEPPSQDDQPTDWRKELIDYLAEGLLPTEKWDAQRLKRRSAHYVVMDGELHRWTATKVLLKCISDEETRLVMAETHEGAAGNHLGGRALALKVKNLGFYWPTMNADCETAPYPFMRWGMDIIGPMPASLQKKFILVLTDYFTKWVEAEAYASITDKEVQNFIWKNIICRHGLPYEIITDNGSQFISHHFKGFCDRWRIRLNMSTPRNPQSNGQAESTNKTIIDGLKKRLDLKKGCWADELDGVLWSHRTTPRGATKATPLSMVYGVEAMAPAEVNVTSLRRSRMPQNVELNRDMLLDALEDIEEKRDQALLRIQNYQHQIESYYNKKVKSRPLEMGNLVLRKAKQYRELGTPNISASSILSQDERLTE